MCIRRPKANGISCGTGMYCDGVGSCQKKQCTVSANCTSLSDTCNMGVCNTSAGACVRQPKANGISCSDGLYCNGPETCQSGYCIRGLIFNCNSQSDQCNNGVCDENSDKCVKQPKPKGASCADGYCDGAGVCLRKQCTVSANCTSLSDLCNDGICDTATWQCVKQPRANGISCSDGLYCNGVETCQNGRCIMGYGIDCSYLNEQCRTGRCDEATRQCISQQDPNGQSCSDGIYCTMGDTCWQGVCSGGAQRVCNDGNSCTVDLCNDNMNTCSYTWPSCGYSDGCCAPDCNNMAGYTNYDPDCAASGLCWNGRQEYLLRDPVQAKKFCKCATGTYNYMSYNFVSGVTYVAEYISDADDLNWNTRAVSIGSGATSVICSDGFNYPTNQDYYY